MDPIKIIPTLRKRAHDLASAERQRGALDALPLKRSFEDAAEAAGHGPLTSRSVEVLQINVGKRCNQTCRHCHVDAGPDRREVMPPEVVAKLAKAVNDATQLPEVQSFFRDKLYTEPVTETSAQFKTYAEQQFAKWRALAGQVVIPK